MEAAIITTYRCTNKCHMCNIWKHPTKAEEEFKPEILNNLPRLFFANITGGEPFLRDDIEEIVSTLKKKAKRIVISTNGYFTDKIVSVAKKNPDIGIRISIEGLPHINDELRGVKDGFDRGLRTLIELHRHGLKDIGFGITVSDKNILDMMELYELAKMMRLEFATAAVHNTYYFHKFDNKITRIEEFNREFDRLIMDMLRSRRPKNWFRAYFNYGLKNYANNGKRLLPCKAGSNLFFIDPLAELRPCNGMEVSMGNLKERKFEELWNNKTSDEIRKKVADCDKNCWMIGSVAPIMKARIWIPALWVIRQKLQLILGKNPYLDDIPKK